MTRYVEDWLAQFCIVLLLQAQYLFIYDALLHSYLYGITNVIEAELSDHIKALSEPLSEETPDATRLDKEFEVHRLNHIGYIIYYAYDGIYL